MNSSRKWNKIKYSCRNKARNDSTRKRERVAGIKIKEKGKLKQIDGKRKKLKIMSKMKR